MLNLKNNSFKGCHYQHISRTKVAQPDIVDDMANQQVIADAPTTFRDLFGTMGDVYNGVYAPYLAKYRTNEWRIVQYY